MRLLQLPGSVICALVGHDGGLPAACRASPACEEKVCEALSFYRASAAIFRFRLCRSSHLARHAERPAAARPSCAAHGVRPQLKAGCFLASKTVPFLYQLAICERRWHTPEEDSWRTHGLSQLRERHWLADETTLLFVCKEMKACHCKEMKACLSLQTTQGKAVFQTNKGQCSSCYQPAARLSQCRTQNSSRPRTSAAPS